MKKCFSTVLVLLILPFVCGCVPLIIGAAAGGLGAYAVSKDTEQVAPRLAAGSFT